MPILPIILEFLFAGTLGYAAITKTENIKLKEQVGLIEPKETGLDKLLSKVIWISAIYMFAKLIQLIIDIRK